MDSIGIQFEGQKRGGEKVRQSKPNLCPPVDNIKVFAKAGNLFKSIWRNKAEAERLGCTLLLLLKGTLITVIGPCVH